MIGCREIPWLACLLSAVAVVLAGEVRPVEAQWAGSVPSGQFELAEAVQVDQADNAVLAQLERVKTLLADRQWDEAIEILRQTMETSEGKLVAVGPRRYVGVRDWCQLRLASLPPEALKLYRGRVDPVAQKWYERGIARHDRQLLQNIVDQAFVSSYGDDALLALGEMAFESGDYAAARWDWEQIVPAGKKGAGARVQPSELAQRQPTTNNQISPPPAPRPPPPFPWPTYPDTHLDLAAVRARLVLVSIVEGATERARAELAEFARLHPEAKGRLGGHEGKYVELLSALLAESASWPAARADPDWPTFAGNPQRNKIADRLIDVGLVAWRVPLVSPRPMGEGAGVRGLANSPHPSPLPKGEGTLHAEPLSFHPLLVGDLALVNNEQQILALRRDTGEPAWGQTAAVYQAELAGVAHLPTVLSGALGSPRFTMTVFQNRLLARMGSAVTSQPQGATAATGPGYLVCLDLAAQGRLLWKITPEEGWTFEGSPVVDENGIYVAMRRQDIRPQAMVACFEPDTGRLRWRRFICGAETPARGAMPEYTHNLLTLSNGTIYYNTNLGAVAALCAEDGRIHWVSLYPRALRGDLAKLAPHWRRDLNPCVLDQGTLLVAPADSPRIFAFDAATGAMLWQTGTEVEDALSLLGTTGDWLIAGGGRLYWISLKDADRGRVKHVWPDGPDRPGYGRGVLADGSVLWPTRDKLYIFDQRTAHLEKAVDLTARGASGGNLLVDRGQLLIATEDELIAISPYGRIPSARKTSKTEN
jgi:hypothetical protein